MGVDVDEVESTRVAFSAWMNAEGLATHEIVTVGKRGSSLGVRCDGEMGIVAPKPERDALLDQFPLALFNVTASPKTVRVAVSVT